MHGGNSLIRLCDQKFQVLIGNESNKNIRENVPRVQILSLLHCGYTYTTTFDESPDLSNAPLIGQKLRCYTPKNSVNHRNPIYWSLLAEKSVKPRVTAILPRSAVLPIVFQIEMKFHYHAIRGVGNSGYTSMS